MTPREQAELTLSFYLTGGVISFWVNGPFLHSATDDRYRCDVTAPDALEILEACYTARLSQSQRAAPEPMTRAEEYEEVTRR